MKTLLFVSWDKDSPRNDSNSSSGALYESLIQKSEANVLVSKHNPRNNHLLIIVLYIHGEYLSNFYFIVFEISEHKTCSILNAMQNEG